MRMRRNRVRQRFVRPHPPCERGRAPGGIPRHTPPRSAGGFRSRCDTGIRARSPNSVHGTPTVPIVHPGQRYRAPGGRSWLSEIVRPSGAHLAANNWPPDRRHARRDRCGPRDELGWPCRQSPQCPLQFSLNRPGIRLTLRSDEIPAVVAHPHADDLTGRGVEPFLIQRTRSGPSARHRHDAAPASKFGCSRHWLPRTGAR